MAKFGKDCCGVYYYGEFSVIILGVFIDVRILLLLFYGKKFLLELLALFYGFFGNKFSKVLLFVVKFSADSVYKFSYYYNWFIYFKRVIF